jgi:hypothetical protein
VREFDDEKRPETESATLRRPLRVPKPPDPTTLRSMPAAAAYSRRKRGGTEDRSGDAKLSDTIMMLILFALRDIGHKNLRR